MGKTLVVSAINIVDGGALTVLKDSLSSFNKLGRQARIIFLVSREGVIDETQYPNLTFYYFPKSKSSWLYRLYYEYIHFYFLSRKLKVDSWLSLHDTTPNVVASSRYVYCHNASVFFKFPYSDIFLDPKLFLFSRFYKYLYSMNIKKNKRVFVQQGWMAEEFVKMFGLNNLVVASPDINSPPPVRSGEDCGLMKNPLKLFYPAFPRYFKNHGLILAASSVLQEAKFFLSITGKETPYIRKVVGGRDFDNCVFLGAMSLPEVYDFYNRCDALVFPSLLETWGLPLTEIKQFNKPIIAADLPYAHETVGDYPFVYWFDPASVDSFVAAVQKLSKGVEFDSPKIKKYSFEKISGWDSFANYLMSEL